MESKAGFFSRLIYLELWWCENSSHHLSWRFLQDKIATSSPEEAAKEAPCFFFAANVLEEIEEISLQKFEKK